MKKILLGTSALISAFMLTNPAYAEDPKITVSGFSIFEAGWTNSDFETNEQHQAFRNDNEIHFNVAGKTDAGLGYGAEIDLEADVNGGGDNSFSNNFSSPGNNNSGLVAHRTYGWLQGDNWGHLEFGSNDGPALTMKVDASTIARATGGIDGDFKYFADVNTHTGSSTSTVEGASGGFTGGTTNSFISSPNLPVENGSARGFSSDIWSNDTKITYYTPRFTGFQVGVSYAPSLTNTGELTSRTIGTTGFISAASDIWEGALNYQNQFGQVGVSAAVTGETGRVSSNGNLFTPVNNLNAWNAGAKLSYLGFSAAGSYGNWGDSFDIGGVQADYWTLGGAYENGALGVSVTYLRSEDLGPSNQDNMFQDASVGVDYKLAPGLTPFIEYTWYDINPGERSSVALENKGNVVIVGSQLSF